MIGESTKSSCNYSLANQKLKEQVKKKQEPQFLQWDPDELTTVPGKWFTRFQLYFRAVTLFIIWQDSPVANPNILICS